MAASLWKVCRHTKYVRRTLFPVAPKHVQCFSSKSNNPENTLSMDSLFSDTDNSSNVSSNQRPPSAKDSDSFNELNIDASETLSADDSQKSFATLLRESRFMQLGDLKNKLVSGRITDVQGNDLYIDFGGKFGCVCPRPSYQPDKYIRGAYVKLNMNKFEMTSKFLGSEKHVTLLEADCTLLGTFSSQSSSKSTTSDTKGSKNSNS